MQTFFNITTTLNFLQQDNKMEALVDHLNNYSKHGIPQLPNADEDLEEGETPYTT